MLLAMQGALSAKLHGHAAASRAVTLAELDACLERPRALIRSGQDSPTRLAASYATALCRSRPFASGNMALALMAAFVVLRLRGLDLTTPEVEAAAAIRALAERQISEPEFARWLEARAIPAG